MHGSAPNGRFPVRLALSVRWPISDGPRPPGGRVFLVDDHAGFRSVVREFLEDAGFELVGEADSGASALDSIRIAARDGPMVVLMDVRMPGTLNGIDVTRRLTSSRVNVEVIVLTAFPEEGINQAAKEAGAIAFLVKGAASAEIIAAVGDAWAAVRRTSSGTHETPDREGT